MKITIIGRGNVGGTLQRLLSANGHEVDALGSDGGDASGADVLMLAVPGGAVEEALGAVSGVQAAHAAGQQAKTAERAQKVQAESARQAQQVAQPAAAFGQQELSQAAAGQIPGPIQAQIDEWAQAAKQKAQDYAARSGQASAGE